MLIKVSLIQEKLKHGMSRGSRSSNYDNIWDVSNLVPILASLPLASSLQLGTEGDLQLLESGEALQPIRQHYKVWANGNLQRLEGGESPHPLWQSGQRVASAYPQMVECGEEEGGLLLLRQSS